MALPDLVRYKSVDEYRAHFDRCYVNADTPIQTIDGITVKFFRENFDHAFFESSSREKKNKEVFATDRAERIDWIRFTLEAEKAEVFMTVHDSGAKRRLSLLLGAYLVVIQLDNETSARFITAFVHDNPERVRRGPRNKRIWPEKKKDR